MVAPDFSDLTGFCLFVGYPRSGHSLIGAMLNAHPDILIAHELDALSWVAKGISRDRLFQMILEADRQFVERGSEWSGYSYKVPGQWQGRLRRLRIIGDKKGGRSTLLLQRNPGLIARLQQLTEIPVHFIHVVRNPFDNIATMSLKNRLSLSESVESYLLRCRFIHQFSLGLSESEFITLRHEEAIENPAGSLERLCGFLRVEPDAGYLSDCSRIVFKSASRTRERVSWDSSTVARVSKAIDEIPFLSSYRMDG